MDAQTDILNKLASTLSDEIALRGPESIEPALFATLELMVSMWLSFHSTVQGQTAASQRDRDRYTANVRATMLKGIDAGHKVIAADNPTVVGCQVGQVEFNGRIAFFSDQGGR